MVSGIDSRIENSDADSMTVDSSGAGGSVVSYERRAGCCFEVTRAGGIAIKRDVFDPVIIGQVEKSARRDLDGSSLPVVEASEDCSAEIVDPAHHIAEGSALF